MGLFSVVPPIGRPTLQRRRHEVAPQRHSVSSRHPPFGSKFIPLSRGGGGPSDTGEGEGGVWKERCPPTPRPPPSRTLPSSAAAPAAGADSEPGAEANAARAAPASAASAVSAEPTPKDGIGNININMYCHIILFADGVSLPLSVGPRPLSAPSSSRAFQVPRGPFFSLHLFSCDELPSPLPSPSPSPFSTKIKWGLRRA